MAQQNDPTNPAPPPGFMEYFALLVQNGTFPPPMAQTPALSAIPSTPIPDASPLPTEGRLFTRSGRGQGGALTEKRRVSKQITASATKRKSLVDPDVETHPSTLDSTGKSIGAKSAKRAKTKVMGTPQSFSLTTHELTIQGSIQRGMKLPPQGPAQTVPVPDSPAHTDPIPSPVRPDGN